MNDGGPASNGSGDGGPTTAGATPAPTISIVVISKDEPALADTLDLLEREAATANPGAVDHVELVVVDASSGRLDAIRAAHPEVRWLDFERPPGVRVSIPHQRNAGVRSASGRIVVFTDCGCLPEAGWLGRLVAPVLAGEERITSGPSGAAGPLDPYRKVAPSGAGPEKRYLQECSTINLAFERALFDEVGGFDETFQYGSDVDFSWRVVHRGVKIRYLEDAIVLHDWGSRRRQLKRSFAYGRARAHLYAKHVLGSGEQSIRKRTVAERDLVSIAYPLYLLGLPLALRYRAYLLLLVVPIVRGHRDQPLRALVDNLVLGAGVLVGAKELIAERLG